MKKALFALILSVFIHLLLMTGVLVFPVSPLPPRVGNVEIEIQDSSRSQNETNRQIVREAVVPDAMKVEDSEDETTLLSAQRQRVRKQTRAAEIGRTENRSQTKSDRQPGSGSPRGGLLSRKELLDAAADATRIRPRTSSRGAASQNGGSNMGPGFSTIGESLSSDIQIGAVTALNTDRYLFYSFFARVEDLIRFRWETAAKAAMDSTPREKLAANVRARWTTHMEVLLNPQGELQKVILMKSSGLPAFDQAAVFAFTEARLFPNPPVEMVEDDGLIHLKYSFTIYYDPRLVAGPSSP